MVPVVLIVLRYSAEILRTNIAKHRKRTVGPNAAKLSHCENVANPFAAISPDGIINSTFANVVFHPMDLAARYLSDLILESDHICHSASQGISFHDALRPDTWLHCF